MFNLAERLRLVHFAPWLTDNSNAFLLTTSIAVGFSFVSNLILTRLLLPENFAVAGLIASFFIVAHLLTDIGVSSFVVRHKEGQSHELLDTVWSLRLMRGFLLAVISATSSIFITSYLGFPYLAPVFLVCSIHFALEPFQSMNPILAEHSNDVAKPLYIELFITGCTKLSIITVALVTGSYWAFVVGLFFGEILKIYTSHAWYQAGFQRFKVSKKYLLEVWNYCKIVLPASIITLILIQGDKAVLAKTLVLSEMGLYFLALSFSGIASYFIVGYNSRVLLPKAAFVIRNEPKKLLEAFQDKKTNTLGIATFSMGLLAGSSPVLISYLYPVEYLGAATFLSILLIHPVLSCFSNPAETQLFCIGHTRVVFFANLFRLAWVLIVTWPAYSIFGSVGVVAVFATRELASSVYLVILLHREKLINYFVELQILMMSLVGYVLAQIVF